MSRRGWNLFIAMSLLWGSTFFLIKVAVTEMPPAAVVFGRTAMSAVILIPLAAMRGQLQPVLRRWPMVAVFALVEIGIPWLMLGYAEQRLTSSLTGLLVATVPLFSALLASVTGHEVFRSRQVVGLLTGFAGVAVLVGFDVRSADVTAVLAVGTVAVCYAIGTLIVARHLSDLPELGVVASSILLTAVLYTPVGLSHWPSSLSLETWLSVATLAVVSTGVGFVLYFRLIAVVGPTRANVIAYIHPAVALTLGVVILNEPVTTTTGIGFALILVGSIFATLRTATRKDESGNRTM